MKLYYSESEPIVVNENPPKNIKVPLVANYICLKIDNRFRIKGIVYDANSGIPLKDVQVIILTCNQNESCTTNKDGIFKTKLSYCCQRFYIMFEKRGYYSACFYSDCYTGKKIKVCLRKIKY